MTPRNLARPVFICLHFKVARDGGHGLEGVFMVKNDPMEDSCSGLRYARGESIHGLYLQDLRITAYARPGAGGGKLVLQDVAYRRKLPVDLQTATAMAKTLGKIEKGLRALREAEGWVDDFVPFVFRVALVTGASVVTLAEDDHSPHNTYRELAPDSLSAQIRCWQAEPGLTPDEEGGADGQTR